MDWETFGSGFLLGTAAAGLLYSWMFRRVAVLLGQIILGEGEGEDEAGEDGGEGT